jgi:cobalt-zinc-cadmium efflux system membrane fusion protein
MKTLTRIIILSIIIVATGCTEAEVPTNDHDHVHDHKQSLSMDDAASLQLSFSTPSSQITGDSIEARGIVHAPPQSRIDISLPYGGLVSDIQYYEGSFVQKGSVLARVSHNDLISLQEDYLKTLVRKEAAKAGFDRQQKLGVEAATSEKAMQEASAELKSLEAQTQSLRARLKLAGFDPEAVERNGIQDDVVVRAPISGYITEVLANTGMYVSANAAIYRMVDNSHLHIELSVFPDKVHKISAGQNVYFYLNNNSRRLHGKVQLISHNVDEQKRSVNVHVHPDEGIQGLIPGMYVSASIFIKADSVNVLPRAAAAKIDGKWYAMVRDGEQLSAYELTDEQVGSKYVLLSPGESRSFVTTNLERSLAALLGNDNETGHNH